MLALVALAALVPIQYQLPPGQPVRYDVAVRFSGFIPILGGMDGQVDVEMDVEAAGLAPDEEGQPRASSEIKELALLLNGTKMPFGLNNVTSYFPKTTVSMTPQGKVLKTDAPDISPPARLPGLDVKRFPDISYLPIEFPAEGIEVGKPFEFKKAFGDTDMAYVVTPTAIEDGTVSLAIELSQTYQTLEDPALNVVTDGRDAVSKVETALSGKGTAKFDRAKGLVSEAEIATTALSKVTDIKAGSTTDRKLDTRLTIKLRKPKAPG